MTTVDVMSKNDSTAPRTARSTASTGCAATTAAEVDGPVWMVNLMKYREVADYADGRESSISGQEADDLYTPLESLAAIGADLVFAGQVDQQLLGDAPVWDRIGVVKYPTRKSFIEMQSRPDFQTAHQHKDAGMEQTIVMGCQPMPALAAPPGTSAVDWSDVPHPPTDDDGPVMVVHVLRFADADAAKTDPAKGVAQTDPARDPPRPTPPRPTRQTDPAEPRRDGRVLLGGGRGRCEARCPDRRVVCRRGHDRR